MPAARDPPGPAHQRGGRAGSARDLAQPERAIPVWPRPTVTLIATASPSPGDRRRRSPVHRSGCLARLGHPAAFRRRRLALKLRHPRPSTRRSCWWPSGSPRSVARATSPRRDTRSASSRCLARPAAPICGSWAGAGDCRRIAALDLRMYGQYELPSLRPSGRMEMPQVSAAGVGANDADEPRAREMVSDNGRAEQVRC